MSHPFPFLNEVKGLVAETLVSALFQAAGCHTVHPSGLHSFFPYARGFSKEEYDRLPVHLRKLPDLHTVPRDGPAYWIEVKFVSWFNRDSARSLHGKLTQQVAHYPDVHAVVCRGHTADPGDRRHEDLIRVIPPDRLYRISPAEVDACRISGGGSGSEGELEVVWRSLPTLPVAFPWMAAHHSSLADQIVPVLRALGGL